MHLWDECGNSTDCAGIEPRGLKPLNNARNGVWVSFPAAGHSLELVRRKPIRPAYRTGEIA